MHSAVTLDKAEHSFISCKLELPETHTPPNRWGNVSQTLTEAKNPVK